MCGEIEVVEAHKVNGEIVERYGVFFDSLLSAKKYLQLTWEERSAVFCERGILDADGNVIDLAWSLNRCETFIHLDGPNESFIFSLIVSSDE